MKVALAPIITDLPIIILAMLFLSVVSGYTPILGMISITGGFYLGYLAYESFKNEGISKDIDLETPKSLKKGVAINLLNPAPYLFWITIGGPLIIHAYLENPLSPLLFITGFYGLLVGLK
jgi:threonine/homoserine/homoserine lactone efflux protein